MQDEYTGLAGTYYIDPEKGIRVTQEQWDAEQAAKAAALANPPKTAKPTNGGV